MSRTQLYRHFDKRGRLLYVGVSLNTVARLAQHRDQAHWFDRITRIEIESFATRQEACKAEAEAIREERPFYNKVFNRNGLAKSLHPCDIARLKHINEEYDHLVSKVNFRGDVDYYVKVKSKYLGKVPGELGSDAFFDAYMALRRRFDAQLEADIKAYYSAKYPGVEYHGEVNGVPQFSIRVAA
jgi:predicted GIY-YIG superfamily endonuclease